MKETSRT